MTTTDLPRPIAREDIRVGDRIRVEWTGLDAEPTRSKERPVTDDYTSAEAAATPTDPVRVLAQRIAHDLLAYYGEDGDEWEVYPEVGEHDWQQVVAAVRDLAPPVPEDWRDALDALAARAEGDDGE